MTASRLRQGAVVTSCAGLALSWVYAGAAEAAEASGFTVGGTSVTLSSNANHATALKPGMYSTKLPAQSSTWYTTITRQRGERLQVGLLGELTWDGGAYVLSSGNSQDLTFALQTSDGTLCESNDLPVPTGARRGSIFQSYLMADPDNSHRVQTQGQESRACRDATSFQLSLKRSIAGAQAGALPIQLSVITAPAVPSAVPAPSTSTLGAVPVKPGNPTSKLTPGHGVLDAPAVQPKAYTVDAIPGQPMFVKVHLSPGQRLAADWQLPNSQSSVTAAQDLKVAATIYTPGLAEASLGDPNAAPMLKDLSPSTTGSIDVSTYTAPVNFGNANIAFTSQQSSLARAWFQTDPGWYYVALSAVPDVKNKNDQTLKSTTPITSTLTLQVTGNATDGPKMAVAQPKPGRISGAPTSSRVNPAVWGGLAALGALAVVGTAVFMRRRAR